MRHLIDLIVRLIELIVAIGEKMLKAVFDLIGGMISPEMTEEIRKVLAYVDYFFPLREAVGFGLVLFTVWAAVAAYRAIKSWIPTVGS
ncbi:hypothetical protein [Ereboglobus sp. PH5-10]|uniref:hypothetical protein n=1 Tax=Ereboglobus sp. PH5-10 TaxID=2940629 RepID=UPI002405300E|nr:hypothetical protein [Ereboglobus sp. PH5-10]